MKKKVSILEIVATKIVIALLVAGYYWMWSRSDWVPEYRQYSAYFGGFLSLILLAHYLRVHKYKKECFDELAIKTLHKCDAICLKVLTVLMIRRPPRSTRKESSAASDVYKRQYQY